MRQILLGLIFTSLLGGCVPSLGIIAIGSSSDDPTPKTLVGSWYLERTWYRQGGHNDVEYGWWIEFRPNGTVRYARSEGPVAGGTPLNVPVTCFDGNYTLEGHKLLLRDGVGAHHGVVRFMPAAAILEGDFFGADIETGRLRYGELPRECR